MFAFLYCLHTKSSRRKYIFAHHSLGSNAAVVQICLLSRDRCSLSIYSYCLMSKREIYPWILKFCYSSWQQSEDVFGCWCPLTPFLFSRVLWRGWPLLSLGGSSLLLGFLQLCVTEVLSDPSCGPGGGGAASPANDNMAWNTDLYFASKTPSCCFVSFQLSLQQHLLIVVITVTLTSTTLYYCWPCPY